jgi:hypothetical protein
VLIIGRQQAQDKKSCPSHASSLQACPESVLALLPYAVPVLEERLVGGGPGWGPAQLQASAEAAAAGTAPAALPKVSIWV